MGAPVSTISWRVSDDGFTVVDAHGREVAKPDGTAAAELIALAPETFLVLCALVAEIVGINHDYCAANGLVPSEEGRFSEALDDAITLIGYARELGIPLNYEVAK